jgi:nucleoside permease NupC
VLLARIDLIGRVSHVYLNLVPLSRNDIVFNKVGNANLLHAFLLLEAQRVYMGSGCNRLKTVARDIYNFIVGGLLNDYMMHRHLVLSVLCWLIFMNTLCDA